MTYNVFGAWDIKPSTQLNSTQRDFSFINLFKPPDVISWGIDFTKVNASLILRKLLILLTIGCYSPSYLTRIMICQQGFVFGS